MNQQERMETFVESVKTAMSRGVSPMDLFLLFLLFAASIGSAFFISWAYQNRFRLRRFLVYLWRLLTGRTEFSSLRRDLEFPVLLIRPEAGRPTERTKTYDVSRGGMFIRTSSPYPVQSTFPFHLYLSENDILQGVGLVRWVQNTSSPSHPAGMGIEFIDMSDSEKNRLRAYAQKTRRRRKVPLNARGSV
jgi:hypothetical protein